MTTFDERLAVGEALEARVATELEAYGWTVTHWGQGMMPAPIRTAITETRFASFPDLVAARGLDIVAIDCKDSLHSAERGTYALSRRCVDFGYQFVGCFGIPVFYVFGNLRVMMPSDVTSYGGLRSRGKTGSWYLVDSSLAHRFEHVFGTSRENVA